MENISTKRTKKKSLVSSTIWEIQYFIAMQKILNLTVRSRNQLKYCIHTNAANLSPQTSCLPSASKLHLHLSKSFQNSFMLLLVKSWKAIVNSQSFTGATDSQLEWTYYEEIHWYKFSNSKRW